MEHHLFLNPEGLLYEFLERLEQKTTEELLADVEKAREDSRDSWMFDEELEDVIYVVLGTSKKFPKKLSRAKHNYVASPLAATRPGQKWHHCN